MATRISRASGNFTAAATWAAVHAGSLLNSEAANTALTTSYVGSSAFALDGATELDGIAVKIASRASSPSGTMSVELYDSTGGASVAGTEVTINVADLSLCATGAVTDNAVLEFIVDCDGTQGWVNVDTWSVS